MGQRLKQIDKIFIPPGGHNDVLIHSCCAPCVGPVMEQMIAADLKITVYFYNPNIHPKKEYEMRKEENVRFCKKHDIPFIDADYDVDNWFDITAGHEKDPERGERCSMCFDMRFVKTAKYAHENGFKVFTSSLGISRWKDFTQVTNSGIKAASLFEGVDYWEFNWRKKGGSSRMIELAKEEEFYQQQYCGCVYSLRDSNQWRLAKGRQKINLGNDFYTNEKDQSILE
ncbi:MAG: putative adenine nucleotide alpha hydrolase (AANH) superfamily ATPase [Candidatus Omnitrophota bacterium]|jgi:predicted adenine nucleotide alpha hydrolase (AANH) superfamily ATPase